MRPVNLIPSDQQRGTGTPFRSGTGSYVLVGMLAVVLIAVGALAMSSKQVSDRKAEVSQLESDLDVATARAQSLRKFADFRSLQEARSATVTSLANSRFDWERVMRELALVLPSDVWLIQLGATSSPEQAVDNGPSLSTRAAIPGPALEMVGCATSQDEVASFMTALEDIDGVTRVGVASSERPEAVASGTAGGAGGAEDCRTRDTIVKFEIVVAFDQAPVPPSADAAAPVVPASAPAAPEGEQPPTEQAEAASVEEQTAKVDEKRDAIPGG